MACRCGSMRSSCIGRGNGARAGWACQLYEQLGLDRFWALFTRRNVLAAHPADAGVLSTDRSRQRMGLHRQWFEQSAMGDLLSGDFALVEKNALYRCLD